MDSSVPVKEFFLVAGIPKGLRIFFQNYHGLVLLSLEALKRQKVQMFGHKELSSSMNFEAGARIVDTGSPLSGL